MKDFYFFALLFVSQGLIGSKNQFDGESDPACDIDFLSQEFNASDTFQPWTPARKHSSPCSLVSPESLFIETQFPLDGYINHEIICRAHINEKWSKYFIALQQMFMQKTFSLQREEIDCLKRKIEAINCPKKLPVNTGHLSAGAGALRPKVFINPTEI